MIPFSVPPADEDALRAGRNPIHALNFFVAAMQTGFGPFLAVWLVSEGWSLTQVGVALSVGTIAALCVQLPGGILIDAISDKRNITVAALAAVAISALLIALVPSVPVVWAAEILHSFGSAVITPAIAALTLTLSGTDGFSDRLGGNARYASLGTAVAAVALGLGSSGLGAQSIFIIAAALALPAAASLLAIKPGPKVPTAEDHMALAPMKDRDKPWTIFRDPTIHIFAMCVVLFHLSNAALLPLALGELSERGTVSDFLVPATIMVPQIVAAIASPRAGAMARYVGRRKVLLVGFIALPTRAVLFALNPGPEALVVIQILDGVSATVLGLMLPLIAADLTRKSGHLNLAIGAFGLSAGLGATFSTTVSGWVADRMGAEVAFLGLAKIDASTKLFAQTMAPAGVFVPMWPWNRSPTVW